jgi:F0F1-type ATP synthase membrane subunit b/b'
MKLSFHAVNLFVAVVLALVGASECALASSGNRAPALSDLTFYWINFVLYIAVMTFILRKPIRNGWASRTARIKKTVAECTDEVESAERELNAIEALTKGLVTEQERVRQEILAQAKVEADDIVRNAHQRASRIREQAKEMLKGETRSAESSFRASLVSRALQIAKERFTKGEFANRERVYVDAAVERSRQLVR